MHIILGGKSQDSEHLPITINCPWCNQRGITASAWERTEWLTLFHIIPVMRFRTVFVRCQSCKKELIARCSFKELVNRNPNSLQLLLAKRVPLITTVCAIIGLLLCWAPILGLIPALVAFLSSRRQSGWVSKASIIGLILSSCSTLLGFLALVWDILRSEKIL